MFILCAHHVYCVSHQYNLQRLSLGALRSRLVLICHRCPCSTLICAFKISLKSLVVNVVLFTQELGTPNDKIWPGPPAYSEYSMVKKVSIFIKINGFLQLSCIYLLYFFLSRSLSSCLVISEWWFCICHLDV